MLMLDTQLRRIDDGRFAQRQNIKPHIRKVRVLLAQFFVKQHIRHCELIVRRVYMAIRGICKAIASAGPQTLFAHVEADVDRYLDVADAFIRVAVS